MSHETVYAIASGKGGVGKTTTTVNLGAALASAGRRVVIVDADLGMANLAGFIDLDASGQTLHDVLAGDAGIESATYRLGENLVAVPSGGDLEGYAATSPDGLGEAIATLADGADVVLLDVGAGVSHETVLPLGLADAVLIVSTPEPASVHDATKTVDLTERAGGEVAGLVVTRTRPEGDVDPAAIADSVDVPLLGSIPDDPRVRESVYAGTPLVLHAPDSPASVAYRQLAADLAGIEPPADGGDSATDGGDSATDGGDSATESDDGYGELTDEGGVASHDEVSSAITEAESASDSD